MSSEHVGIEDARKRLGDLVAAAQEGTDVILTRNGRPIARIVSYQPEDTVATIDISRTAAAVIARARSNSDMTAAEFDYDIAVHFAESVNGIGGEFSPLGNANHEIARENDIDPAEQWAALQAELTAYAEKCRDRKYTGWSAASRSRGARISYAN